MKQTAVIYDTTTNEVLGVVLLPEQNEAGATPMPAVRVTYL